MSRRVSNIALNLRRYRTGPRGVPSSKEVLADAQHPTRDSDMEETSAASGSTTTETNESLDALEEDETATEPTATESENSSDHEEAMISEAVQSHDGRRVKVSFPLT